MSVEIKNVSFSFYQGAKKITVLKNLSLSLAKGDVVAVVGRSGSGKSTLLSLMAGLETPSEGSIFIGQKNIVPLSRGELSSFRGKEIGIVFQQFHLVPYLTAAENIALPLEIQNQSDQKRVQELLRHLGLEGQARNLPSQMSGGECQRVAIGRALALKPALILADEPSGSLDQETGEQVMELFFQEIRREKITCLFVTHNLELANRCDRTYILANGGLQLQ